MSTTFRGSIPPAVRSHVGVVARDWIASGTKEIWVGCSGNYTVERVLDAVGVPISHGNDITFYSVVLGRYLSEQPLGVRLRDDWAERFPFLDEGFDGTDAAQVARVLLLSQHALYLDKTGRYYERVAEGIRRQWPRVMEKTQAKVEAVTLRLASFDAGDVTTWISDRVPADAPLMLYPPFYAGDYEAMFAVLESAYEWEPPAFEPLTEERRDAMLEQVADREKWLIGVPHHWEGHEHELRGVTQTSNRGESIYLYSRSAPRMVVMPRQKTEPVPTPRLMPGMRLGNRMWLAPLTEGQFASLRSQYMNAGIKPGQPDLPLAVIVDDVLVGAFAFQRPRLYLDPRCAYLLSDFPVSNTDYDRLAKLVLVAALSSEAQVIVQRMANGPVDSTATTAFTYRPVSMKYRGIFTLHSRKPAPENVEQPLMLDYRSAMPRWTLAEGLAWWKRKHGRVLDRETGEVA